MLAAVLTKTKKVAIGKVAAGGNENVVILRPRDGILSMELMYWPAELLAEDEARFAVEDVKVSSKEIGLGEMLVDHLAMDFDPSQYENKLHEAKLEYLDRFMADEAPADLPTPIKAAKPSDDLAGALEAALAAAGVEPKAKRTKKAAAA
jgi:DNA end-binding protein Ku